MPWGLGGHLRRHSRVLVARRRAWYSDTDLSFNHIEKIEGLGTLTALEDLSLTSNRIGAVEGLDANLALQCLSLGNNQIKALQDTVMYLRRFTRLRLVNLKGNPVERDTDYRTVFLAFLKYVTFLDFGMIESKEVPHARVRAAAA